MTIPGLQGLTSFSKIREANSHIVGNNGSLLWIMAFSDDSDSK
jgi:hypothetical protein